MRRSATEIVDTYNRVVWNEMRPELIPDLCAEPMIRHYSGKRVEFSHAEQMARVESFRERGFSFERVVQFADAEFVTWVWNCKSADGSEKFSGVEIFRVVDGLITEVWNAPYGDDLWG